MLVEKNISNKKHGDIDKLLEDVTLGTNIKYNKKMNYYILWFINIKYSFSKYAIKFYAKNFKNSNATKR